MEEPTRFEKVAPYLKHPLVLIGLGLLLFFGIHRQLIDSGIIPPLDPESGSTVVQAILRYGFWIAMAVVVLGFALQFYKRHLAAAPSVDVEAIIDMLEASHRKQLAALDQQYQGEVDDWKAQAKSAVEALNKLRGQKDAPPGIERALALLAQGQTQSAEAIFLEIANRSEPDIQATAAAYRHLGALAFLHDTQKAIAAYRRATELNPDNAEGWNQLGQLLVRVGELSEAETAYRKVESLGKAANDKEFLAVAYGNLGILYKIRGELDRAETMHRNGLAFDEAMGYKEGMAADYGNLGTVYRIRGELDRAEAMYQKSLALDEALGRKEGMANQYGNLGILYKTRGELDRAEAMQRKALALNEDLGRKEGMAAAYANLGMVYKTRGELDQAEAMYGKSLALFQELGAAPQIEQIKGWLARLK